MQSQWDIYTWDNLRNKWRNHGHIVKLPPEEEYVRRSLEGHRFLYIYPSSIDKAEKYFGKHDDIIYARSKSATKECNDKINLHEAISEHIARQRINTDILYRHTIWDIFSDKNKFHNAAKNINLTEFCSNSDAMFKSFAKYLDPSDFIKISKEDSAKYLRGLTFPSSYFSAPDTLYGETITFSGAVFRKSDGNIYMNSCASAANCRADY